MIDEKRKREAEIPDYRLAKQFNFSANDLSANRAGYMTFAQEWGVPLWVRGRVGWMSDFLPYRQFSRSLRREVGEVCGKVQLSERLHEVSGGRFQVNFRKLLIEGSDLTFGVTSEQARSIVVGNRYVIYYEKNSKQLLSLERIVGKCET